MMRKPNGYWKHPENIAAEARKAMQELGVATLPGADTLHKAGYTRLVSGAQKYHKGIPGLRKLLDQKERLQREKGIWKSPVFTIQQAYKAMKEQGWTTLPSQRILQNSGYCQLARAANIYHDGIPGLRKLLGQQERKKREDGIWKRREYILQQAQQAMQEKGWTTLPSAKVLGRHGYSQIANAAYRHHGGLLRLRKLLAEQLKQPSEQEQLEVLVGGYDA